MTKFRGSPQPDRTRIQAARISAARVQTASATQKVRTDISLLDPQLDNIRERLDNLESPA